ncbi:hypothetical protein B0A52_01453 [Exophiala mesophila]|uniref:Heterokaryon incompatibility domain-containing protein n=1 Tax=Exophiala mesophila TaxID=212818 RepID=A0A438NF10_EXOME|nr:hypothetical protein B0A52_01453 [Exophiala mesophila]
MKPQRYSYRPLDKHARTIRLISKVHMGQHGEITLSLGRVDLEDARDNYTAISYTWGTDKPKHRVWIDGRYLMLRKNIWLFLKYYCDSDQKKMPTKLWADSICIDQENIAERGHQVMFMRDIFHGAANVVIWLAEASINSSLMELESYRWLDQMDQMGRADPVQYHAQLEKFKRQHVQPILDHPYWRRLWVIQEVLLAKNVSIALGDEFESLQSFGRVLGWHDFGAGVLLNKFVSPRGLESESCIHEARDLHGLIEIYGGQECSDIRDKIYGVLGMSISRGRLVADYHCDVVQLASKVLELLYDEQDCCRPKQPPGPWRQYYLDLQKTLRLTDAEMEYATVQWHNLPTYQIWAKVYWQLSDCKCDFCTPRRLRRKWSSALNTISEALIPDFVDYQTYRSRERDKIIKDDRLRRISMNSPATKLTPAEFRKHNLLLDD